MYLSFIQYKELGGTIIADETTFNRLEYKSRADVDVVTNNALKELGTSDFEALKLLMLELIENDYSRYKGDTMSQEYGGKITSMSNDGVSVSISNNTRTEATNKAYRCSLIQRYLPEYSYRGLY